MLAGTAMAALAVAAHGQAGGGYPDSTGSTLLLLAAAAIGVGVSASRSPAALLALMAAGQPVGHVALSGLAHQGHSGTADFAMDGAMAGAHAAAAVAFAFLILVAERLYGVVSQAIRVVSTRPVGLPVRVGGTRWVRAAGRAKSLLGAWAAGPRAPPVTV
ncbi:hypothetical protein [Nocardia huaxiensis]|uniref:Uncharacterized protein n=1 Tax=Nocardia huaxiensis TaxID=2755382 RepID=A0A7D6VJR2_9NOCA|nr:hypothetical protein [Nocardia huaxiensis]QLY31110.1 hypothetical protein H0264_01550 [Nocardia huaxiensis]UFS94638.1 hypothetical protein LPY97_28395 [Nocardia huaxiensis]